MKTPHRKFFISKCSPRRRNVASVLLITLGFILLITVISVAFLVRSRSSLQTSQSYSREMIAKEVGEIGINTIVAQFQKEIEVARANGNQMLLPPRIGVTNTNPRNSALIRRTTGDTAAYNASYSSTSYTYPAFASAPVPNLASTNSTAIPAKNGWSFATNRWEAPKLLRTGETFTAPDWVYVDDQGPTKAASKNIIGRFAAMVYDVGGLLDINEAGVPASVPKGDKGSTAFADISVITGNSTSSDLTAWRGAGVTLNDYYGNSTVTDPKQAGRIESPSAKQKSGENLFFSRMELIEAAEDLKLGLKTDMLPFLRTRSEAANRISVESVYAYGTNSTIDLAHDDLKATKDLTFTVNRIDDSEDTYTIKAGLPILQNRFPLARLRWLADREPDGTPKHQAEIKKYFGLTWNAADKVFVYTSPDGSSPSTVIKTLRSLAAQVNGSGPVREPDFFEWLKAGINPDSLGQTGGSTNRVFPSFPSGAPSLPWEASKDLHILRIGANIIDQSDPDSIATGIRSGFTDVANIEPNPFDSYGQENLPYVNEVITPVLRDGNDLKGYMQFELWNPNRNAKTGDSAPRNYQGDKISNFRVRVLKGLAVMEPFVYITAHGGNDFKIRKPSPAGDTDFNNGTKENSKSPWSTFKRVVEHSQRDLKASDFAPENLADKTIPFSLGPTGAFFSEPYLLNANLTNNNCVEDQSTDPAKVSMEFPNIGVTFPTILGADPAPGKNSLLLCTVKAANDNFTGLRAADLWTSKEYTDWVAAGRPCNKNTGNVGGTQGPAWAEWWEIPQGSKPNVHYDGTLRPSGAKAWNAAQFYANRETYYNFATEPVTFVLELEVQPNKWRTYQIYNELDFATAESGGYGPQASVFSGDTNSKVPSNWSLSSDKANRCFAKMSEWEIRKGYPNIDPRTERFAFTDQLYATPGVSIRNHADPWTNGVLSWNLANGMTNKPGRGYGKGTASNQPPAPGWTFVAGPAPYYAVLADLAVNSGSAGTYSYQDADKLRPADSRWVPADAHPALPTATANVRASRPTILDRPFRSVGELGCVFRDIPWKSLDLFSSDSADRRLLDIFSIEDRATVRGKINPNLAAANTLGALVRGSSLDPSTVGPSSVPDSNADAAALIFSSLNPISDPIHNSAYLAARLSTDPSSKPDGGFSPYKTQAENFIRALSSTTDTRSWQLMLDVVAQSGRILPQTSGNLQDFVVEGQKRYFVYLTIDRITGEIVDRHVEPIYE